VRFEDRESVAGTGVHELALDCLEAGIEAAHPARVVPASLSVAGDTVRVDGASFDLDEYREVQAIGIGKAAGSAAVEVERLLGERLDGGVVVTTEPVSTDRVDVRVGGHPLPDRDGVDGGRELAGVADDADGGTLLLAVVTGGGSALAAVPPEGVPLSALRETTAALLESGAPIGEVNAVRKHLSAVAGGRLAERAAPATVLVLLLSDVVGNDPSTIASGPFAPDGTTYADALAVLERHGIEAPDAARDYLEAGDAGERPETPGRDAPAFDRVRTVVAADGYTAASAAAERARAAGYRSMVLSTRVRGEAREAARTFVAVGEEALATGDPVEPPAVVVAGGETTVTVRGGGTGGPNQEFALAAGGDDGAGTNPDGGRATAPVVAAVDTDGIDGPTDAAGGIVDPTTVTADEAAAALSDNDARTALEERGALLRTGQTGTNVNDLRVLVLPGPGDEGGPGTGGSTV